MIEEQTSFTHAELLQMHINSNPEKFPIGGDIIFSFDNKIDNEAATANSFLVLQDPFFNLEVILNRYEMNINLDVYDFNQRQRRKMGMLLKQYTTAITNGHLHVNRATSNKDGKLKVQLESKGY